MLHSPAHSPVLLDHHPRKKSIWPPQLGVIAILVIVAFSCASGQKSNNSTAHEDRKTRIPAPGNTAVLARAGIKNCHPDCNNSSNEVYLPTAFSAPQVISGTVEVRVDLIPPISGVQFSLDGRIFESDENGFARITVKSPGVYQIEPVPF